MKVLPVFLVLYCISLSHGFLQSPRVKKSISNSRYFSTSMSLINPLDIQSLFDIQDSFSSKSLIDISEASILLPVHNHMMNLQSLSLLLSDEGIGYSKLSLYFTLALYLISLPGLYSLVTRSVKAKPVQKIYDVPGPANPTAKPLRQTAAEVMAYFKALNYESNVTPEVITFRGVMGRSNSQAAFLTFCTLIALGSAGLVISILFPDVGNYAYLVTLLSPYAGIYYWNNAQRIEEIQVKMETSDDEQITSIIARGGKEDLERFSLTLNLPERGKVYVKGLFDGAANDPFIEVAKSTIANEVSTEVASMDSTPKQTTP